MRKEKKSALLRLNSKKKKNFIRMEISLCFKGGLSEWVLLLSALGY